MGNSIHVAFKANDRSYFAILKKEIHSIAVGADFSERKVGEIDIIVAELVSNLVKHAGGGDVWIKCIKENEREALEIISVDNGPGMTDVSRMVSDGVSTKNTLGQGLGAMKRLADVFQVYSLKDWGTVTLIRVFKEALPLFAKPPKIEIRSIVLPKPGETVSGDQFFYTLTPEKIKLFLADGLGHGAEAAKAVAEAGKAFLECTEAEPEEIIRYINNYVRKTRGLVGTVAIFDIAARKWKICGVGNISTRLTGASDTRSPMSYNGIIGLNVPRTLNAQEINYENGQLLILCSDGLKTKWDIIRYPAIFRYDMSVLCAALAKDFGRYTDDLSVVVCKINV